MLFDSKHDRLITGMYKCGSVSVEVYVEAFPWKIRTSQNEAKTKLKYRQLVPLSPLPSPPLSSTHTHPHTPRKSTSPAEFLVFHY